MASIDKTTASHSQPAVDMVPVCSALAGEDKIKVKSIRFCAATFRTRSSLTTWWRVR
ncbi:hypothetical protein VFPPC_09796 [Pochonia chlamydosporia 170]|uniref:Uncharacterized protein n=1 Tax=Pochonia chlamydosporia 170 TaxID=1380566 RepID=A0A179FDG6_METCM|nr:hypothetical protein VFPPC_09796 [Pochonia chlamydosporia 170]OAQ63544.1 hypothetical protein VFPPC_09796 [Pochonia chlamydosporia 170]